MTFHSLTRIIEENETTKNLMKSPEPKLYDTRLLPNCGGVILQTYHGSGVGWTATKWFNTEQEAKQWLKGGIASTPRKK